MIAAVVAVALVVGYLEMANRSGDEKVRQFWSAIHVEDEPKARVREVDEPGAHQCVRRFGQWFGRCGQ